MQPTSESIRSTRTPTLIVRELQEERIVVRLWNVGSRQVFLNTLQRFRSEFLLARSIASDCGSDSKNLQRFRSEFLLARPQKINGLDWLVLLATQRPEIDDWCRRYGIQIIEESW